MYIFWGQPVYPLEKGLQYYILRRTANAYELHNAASRDELEATDAREHMFDVLGCICPPRKGARLPCTALPGGFMSAYPPSQNLAPHTSMQNNG